MLVMIFLEYVVFHFASYDDSLQVELVFWNFHEWNRCSHLSQGFINCFVSDNATFAIEWFRMATEVCPQCVFGHTSFHLRFPFGIFGWHASIWKVDNFFWFFWSFGPGPSFEEGIWINMIEMIFDWTFISTYYNEDIVNTGSYWFFNKVLNNEFYRK